MKLGYTVWTWLSDEHSNFARVANPKASFEQALREISFLGYQTVEIFNWFADYFKDDPQEMVDLCNKYGVEFINLYHYLTTDYETDKRRGLEYAEFAQAAGAKYMNLQMSIWRDLPNSRPTSAEGIKLYAFKANEIGQIAKDHGLTLCVHPHANTTVFTTEQIDMFLEETDPSVVSLCLDTAHITLSGGSAVDAVKRYIDRIAYMHLKDIDPDTSLNPEWPMRRFCALGQGTVDFKGVYNVLSQHNFDGVLCIELDYQKVCHFESAAFSRSYLKNVLDI